MFYRKFLEFFRGLLYLFDTIFIIKRDMEQNIERRIKSIIKESIYTVIKEREEDISTKIIKSLQRGSLDEECISLWEEMDDYNKLY